MSSAIKTAEVYISAGIPAWVIPYGDGYAVCFGRYKHRETAEKLRETLHFKHGVRNARIVQED